MKHTRGHDLQLKTTLSASTEEVVLLLDLHQIFVHILRNTKARAKPGMILPQLVWVGECFFFFFHMQGIDLRMHDLNV